MVPTGDARRHVAKAFTDKSYKDILIMRSEYGLDHSPGWEIILRLSRRYAGAGKDALMVLSMAISMLSLLLLPLAFTRVPEAWLAAVLAQCIALPGIWTRFTQARPYLVTEGILVALLLVWSRPSALRRETKVLVLTGLGVAISVWVHGAWYLWAIPVVAFFLSGRVRDAAQLAICVTGGIVGGALLTGYPLVFLKQAIVILITVSTEHVPQWILAGEFRPGEGNFATLLLIAAVYFWRTMITSSSPIPRPGPVMWQIILMWVFGLYTERFWGDWGVPAVMVWLTLQFEKIIPAITSRVRPKHLLYCGLLATALLVHLSHDKDGRYSSYARESVLNARDPSLRAWFPEKDGIFYTAHWPFFFNVFFENPTGDWKYLLGMEPALMPENDLKIYRNIQLSGFLYAAYLPWVAKMTTKDRLVMSGAGTPALRQLEWKNVPGNLWIGRKPAEPTTATVSQD